MVKMSKCQESKIKKSIILYAEFQKMLNEAEKEGAVRVTGRIKEELMDKYTIGSLMTLNKYLKMGKELSKT